MEPKTKKPYRRVYKGSIPDREVLMLLKGKIIRVNADAGEVYGPKGQTLRQFPGSKQNSHLFVHLQHEGKRRGISVAKLVWMSVTRRTVPRGFEIHHKDEDPNNNTWINLYCLYRLDHEKLHGSQLVAPIKQDEVPF